MNAQITPPGCDKCRKSSLSLLLLRPSPIANDKRLIPAGAASIASDQTAMKGVLPSSAVKESRYVLRLLRPGYIHVYIDAPPPGVKNWLVFRVTKEADLVPEESALFSQSDQGVVCPQPGHNVTGMKVLTIPQAHKIRDVWVAFSANLWNKLLRDANKANPAVMQKISLGAPSANTFAPTAANLRSKVLECALSKQVIDGSAENGFAFNSLASQVDQLAADLKRAAECSSKTAGKELAVVLRDPVGIAAELNALRLRRNDLIRKEVSKPEIAHPLNSSNAVSMLKKSIVDINEAESFNAISPLCSKADFDAKAWPPGTEWLPPSAKDRAALAAIVKPQHNSMMPPPKPYFHNEPDFLGDPEQRYHPGNVGNVVYPDHEARFDKLLKKKMAETWDKLAPYVDEDARREWITNFNARMKTEHLMPVESFEKDWRAVCDDAETLAYFDKHFDPNDPNDPRKHHSPGTVYAEENDRINVPGPVSSGAVLDSYLAMWDKAIIDKTAIAARAIVGNQQHWITGIHQQLTGDPGESGMRDKTYDVLKEIDALKKYSWMSNAVVFFGVGQMTACSAAFLSLAARSPTVTAKVASAALRLQQFWAVQQGVDYFRAAMLQGSVKGIAPNMPILIKIMVDADEAMRIFQARGAAAGSSAPRIKHARRHNLKLVISLLTDTDTLRAAGGNAAAVASDTSFGTVKIGDKATRAAIAAAGSVPVLQADQYLKLLQDQSSRTTIAVSAVRNALASAAGKGVNAMHSTMDGRLAIGTMVVQALGIYHSINALQGVTDEKARREVLSGLYDSIAGLTGGFLQTMAVGFEAYQVVKGGQTAAAQSIKLATLRFVANIMGVAGGVINAQALMAKSKEAARDGDTVVAEIYRGSAIAFAGTAVTSFVSGVGIGADLMVAREVGGGVARTVALRIGARGALCALGLTVSGIGLVLLAVGLGMQVAAIMLTPSSIQRWMSRSYFGKKPDIFMGIKERRNDAFPKGQWELELRELQSATSGTATGTK